MPSGSYALLIPLYHGHEGFAWYIILCLGRILQIRHGHSINYYIYNCCYFTSIDHFFYNVNIKEKYLVAIEVAMKSGKTRSGGE